MIRRGASIFLFLLYLSKAMGSEAEEHEKKHVQSKLSSHPCAQSSVPNYHQVPLQFWLYEMSKKTYEDHPKFFTSAVASMRVGVSFVSTFLFRKMLSEQLGTDKLNNEKTKARVQAMPFKERWIARNPGLLMRGVSSFCDNLSISSIYSFFDTVNHPVQAALFLSAQSWLTVPFSYVVQARTYSVDLWRGGKTLVLRTYGDIFRKDYRHFYRGALPKVLADSISWFTFFKIDASYKDRQNDYGFSWRRYVNYVAICTGMDVVFLLPLSNIRTYMQQNPWQKNSLPGAAMWIYKNRGWTGFARGIRPFLATSFLWNALDLGYLSLMQSFKK